jgi:hypothetical protein
LIDYCISSGTVVCLFVFDGAILILFEGNLGIGARFESRPAHGLSINFPGCPQSLQASARIVDTIGF